MQFGKVSFVSSVEENKMGPHSKLNVYSFSVAPEYLFCRVQRGLNDIDGEMDGEAECLGG